MNILQPFHKSDYDVLISWIDSAAMLMQFAGPQLKFPLTVEQLDISLGDEKRFAFKVLDSKEMQMIGHAQIYIGKEMASLGRIIIGDKNERGKGKGQQIIQQLLQKVFGEFKQEIVSLNVFDFNIAAIKCYEKCGFEINPDQKNTREINGKQWTVLNMILHKHKWLINQ